MSNLINHHLWMLLQRYHFLKLPLCGINHKTTTALASRQLFTVFPNNFTICPDTICIVIETSIQTRLQKKTGGTTVSRILCIYRPIYILYTVRMRIGILPYETCLK